MREAIRAVVYAQAGDAATVAQVVELAEIPAPSPGEIQVRVVVSPVHRGDLVGTEVNAPSDGESRALGTEAAGVVVAVGSSVADFGIGDRVAIFPAPGAWSEYVNVPADAAVVVLDGLDDGKASIMLVNSITSFEVLRAVEEIRDFAGSSESVPLVVSAAASAVGRLIVGQAVGRGWPIVAVVRSRHSAGVVRRDSPSVSVVATEDVGWKRELDDLLGGRPVPVIADAHGGSFVREILPFLGDAGTLIVWGDLSAQPWTIATSELLMRELRIRAVSISRWATRDRQVRIADQQAALDLGIRTPELLAVSGTYPLEELQKAIAAARATSGVSLLKLS